MIDDTPIYRLLRHLPGQVSMPHMTGAIHSMAPGNAVLATQAQTTDQCDVAIGIFRLQVVQQLATLVYHPDQTTT